MLEVRAHGSGSSEPARAAPLTILQSIAITVVHGAHESCSATGASPPALMASVLSALATSAVLAAAATSSRSVEGLVRSFVHTLFVRVPSGDKI